MAFLHMLNLCKLMQKHDLMQLHCCTDAVNSRLFCTKVIRDIYWIKFHHQNEQQTEPVDGNWNDRRSRRVFLCFYSSIFQQTSAKFQTFAYNSRTVWSSYMKF